jgi:hypothetical protein
LRATFFFFGAGAVSADSCAIALAAGDSDATSEGCCETSFGAGPAVVIGSAATRDGASGRAVSVGSGSVATIIGGGTRVSGRALSVGLVPAAVTVIGGGVRDGGSERAASVAFGAGATTVADVAAVAEAGGFDVTRDGRFGRAGVTNDVAGDCTALASEGSYGATA